MAVPQLRVFICIVCGRLAYHACMYVQLDSYEDHWGFVYLMPG